MHSDSDSYCIIINISSIIAMVRTTPTMLVRVMQDMSTTWQGVPQYRVGPGYHLKGWCWLLANRIPEESLMNDVIEGSALHPQGQRACCSNNALVIHNAASAEVCHALRVGWMCWHVSVRDIREYVYVCVWVCTYVCECVWVSERVSECVNESLSNTSNKHTYQALFLFQNQLCLQLTPLYGLGLQLARYGAMLQVRALNETLTRPTKL